MYYQAELGFEEKFNCRILQGAEAVESCAHEELELQMCVEGSARATVGGVEYAIRSGDIVLIPCNVEHSAETDGQCRLIYILFGRKLIGDTFDTLQEKSFRQEVLRQNRSAGAPEDSELRDLLYDCLRELTAGDRFSGDSLKARLTEIFVVLARSYSSEEKKDDAEAQSVRGIDEAIKLINECYMERLTVQDAADRCNLSKGYFCRMFRELTGSTFRDKLIQHRMEVAKRLLLSTDMTVGEIASAVGIPVQKSFNRCFRESEKMTPLEYRHVYNYEKSKKEYDRSISESRDRRMKWWREARFGMLIHYGLFSVAGQGDWMQAYEGISPEEYSSLAGGLSYKPGAAREWARLAKDAGCRYAVLTTKHHEGFSLWDSKANPFNSMNYGPHVDIVREFVEGCREFGLRVGFYFSLMDWRHPDSWRCVSDAEARHRYLEYIETLITELLTNYGRIDVLWYMNADPLRSVAKWDSVERNSRLRKLQPDIIINNKSMLSEDFDTRENYSAYWPGRRDWETCLSFDDVAWGYIDEKQTSPYTYSYQQIIRYLCRCSQFGGNMMMNIGPRPDGTVPGSQAKVMRQTGKWLERNGEAVYGMHAKLFNYNLLNANLLSAKIDRKNWYYWLFIWPKERAVGIGGFFSPPKKVSLLVGGMPVDFEYDGYRILLKGLPEKPPVEDAPTVLKLEFDEAPEFVPNSRYSQLTEGRFYQPGR